MENRSFWLNGDEFVRLETSETENDWDNTHIDWTWKKAKAFWQRFREGISNN